MEGAPGLFRALQAEWATVGSRHDAVSRLSAWARCEPVLSGFGSPADLVAFCHGRTDGAWANEVLAALLRSGRSDRLAARTVLQALVPALVVMSRRARAATIGVGGDPDGWDQEVVAIAWEQIDALSESPPRWVATKIRDLTWTRVRTVINRQRRQVAGAAPLDDVDVAASADAARSTAEQLALALGDAVHRGMIGSDAAGVVLRTRVFGFSPAEAAKAVGRTPAWAYKQRERAERSLVAAGAWLPAAS